MRLEGWPRATTFRAAILRDARLRQAPQDKDRKFEDAFVLGASRKRDASRRMAAKAVQAAILRDAREARAPQDEVGARLDMISFNVSLN